MFEKKNFAFYLEYLTYINVIYLTITYDIESQDIWSYVVTKYIHFFFCEML